MEKTKMKFRLFAAVTYLVLGLFFGQNSRAQDSQANKNATPADKSDSNTTPSGVEVEVGIGSRINGPLGNYQTTNGTLSLVNQGRATPQLLTGLGFTFCDATGTPAVETKNVTPTTTKKKWSFCGNQITSRLGVFTSLQFSTGSTQTISGYSVGMTVALGKYLRGLAGFSLSPFNAISPGFETAASQYVSKNPTLFPGIIPANLASSAYGAFDGIQTTSTAPMAGAAPTAVIYYPGATTEVHYKGGFLIGVSLPINIYHLFGGNASGSKSSSTSGN